MKSTELSFSSISALPAKILSSPYALSGCGKISAHALTLNQMPNFAKCSLMIPLILLIFCGPLQAEEGGSAPAVKVPASSEVAREPGPQQSPAETVVWPKPFEPSEEIGADSQISFPTDI